MAVRIDAVYTLQLIRLAANQGHAVAQYTLGECYALGFAVSIDTEKALYWYRKAAAQGHREALRKVASIINSRPRPLHLRILLFFTKPLRILFGFFAQQPPVNGCSSTTQTKFVNTSLPQPPLTGRALVAAQRRADQAMARLIAEEEQDKLRKERDVLNQQSKILKSKAGKSRSRGSSRTKRKSELI
jgi:TPR repeat protein